MQKITKATTDEKLVEIVRKNKEEFKEIIKRYQKPLTRYVLYLCGDNELSNDIVQQTFIKAFINLNAFDSKKKFSSWIYRISHNETINLIKKNKVHFDLEQQINLKDKQNIEDEYIKEELKLLTHKCLENMPVIYKEILLLFFLEEKSYQEISDILQIPKSTVGVRIGRAKIIMKEICKKQIK